MKSAKRAVPAEAHPLSTFMNEAVRPGRTKRTAARLALSAAMREGTLKPGDVLPPEKELAAILGVSLGTVQVALRQLQEVGIIVRRRGDGSKVASTEPLTSSIWHFRFISRRDGKRVRPIAELVDIDMVEQTGIWTDFLGPKPAYCRISRRYAVSGCAPFGAEMYLDPVLVPGLAETHPDEWRMVNIRTELEARYGIFVQGTSQTVQLAPANSISARRLGLQLGGHIYEIFAEAYGPERRPVYFQRLFVPADDYALSFFSGIGA